MCLANLEALGQQLMKQVQPLFLTILTDAATILDRRSFHKNNIVNRQFLLAVSWLVKYIEESHRPSLLLLEDTLCSQLESALKRKLDPGTSFVLQENMYVEDLTAAYICVSARRVGNAISCLEKLVRRKEFRLSCAVLEAICCIVSEDEFVLQNSLLRNLLQSTSSIIKEQAESSEILYRYVFTRLSENCDGHNSLFFKSRILHAFMIVPNWLSKTSSECYLEMLSDKCWADKDSVNILIQCANILAQRSMVNHLISGRLNAIHYHLFNSFIF